MNLKATVLQNNQYSKIVRGFFGYSGYEGTTVDASTIACKIRDFINASGYEAILSITHTETDFVIELNILPRITVKKEA